MHHQRSPRGSRRTAECTRNCVDVAAKGSRSSSLRPLLRGCGRQAAAAGRSCRPPTQTHSCISHMRLFTRGAMRSRVCCCTLQTCQAAWWPLSLQLTCGMRSHFEEHCQRFQMGTSHACAIFSVAVAMALTTWQAVQQPQAGKLVAAWLRQRQQH